VRHHVLGAPPSTDPPPADLTYKGVQVGFALSHPKRPSKADLLAVDTGSIRGIIHTHTNAYFDSINDYIAPIKDGVDGITPVVCLEMRRDRSVSEWESELAELADRIDLGPRGVFELGNEHPPDFTYPGTTPRQDWNGYFAAIEAADRVIRRDRGKKTIMGGPLDREANAMHSFARQRWGSNAGDWPMDGVGIHPYGQAGSNYSRTGALNMVDTRLTNARSSRVPIGLPLWITEMGWGVSGNVNSTLVALEDSVSTSHVGPLNPNTPDPDDRMSRSLVGSNITIPCVNAGAFAANGWIWTRNTANQMVVLTYGSKTATSFVDCNGGFGSLAHGQTISKWVPTSGARETEQAALLTDVYNRLWKRRFPTDAQVSAAGGKLPALNLRAIGWFIWNDYVGHTPPPTGPVTWAEFCGLNDWADAADRPALAAFGAQPPSMLRNP
jgi:hypothetical protein